MNNYMKKEDIKSNRLKLGWSLEELHLKSGINLQSLEDFESGKREASTPISRLLSLTFTGRRDKMTTRLDYVAWDEISETKQQMAKKLYQELESFIDSAFGSSREKSLAVTKLEESWMWVGKSIKVDQEHRNENLNKNLTDLGLSPREF